MKGGVNLATITRNYEEIVAKAKATKKLRYPDGVTVMRTKLRCWTVQREILYGIMLQRKLTVKMLAKQIGIRPDIVRQWIYFDEMPRLEYHDLLVSIFGYPMEVLFAQKPANVSDKICLFLWNIFDKTKMFDGRMLKLTGNDFTRELKCTYPSFISGLNLLKNQGIVDYMKDKDGYHYIILLDLELLMENVHIPPN